MLSVDRAWDQLCGAGKTLLGKLPVKEPHPIHYDEMESATANDRQDR